jgi:hypothetical protein
MSENRPVYELSLRDIVDVPALHWLVRRIPLGGLLWITFWFGLFACLLLGLERTPKPPVDPPGQVMTG